MHIAGAPWKLAVVLTELSTENSKSGIVKKQMLEFDCINFTFFT